jgi:hypothetical protein
MAGHVVALLGHAVEEQKAETGKLKFKITMQFWGRGMHFWAARRKSKNREVEIGNWVGLAGRAVPCAVLHSQARHKENSLIRNKTTGHMHSDAFSNASAIIVVGSGRIDRPG